MEDNQHSETSVTAMQFVSNTRIDSAANDEILSSGDESNEIDSVIATSATEEPVDIWIDAGAKSRAEELISVLRSASKNHTAGALEIGKHLLVIKETCLKERMFGVWLKEFEVREGINIRSAQRWMKPAKFFAGHLETVSVLSLDLLGKLSKPTLASVRQTVIHLLEQGGEHSVLEAVSYAQKQLALTVRPSEGRSKNHSQASECINIPDEMTSELADVIATFFDGEDMLMRTLVEKHGLEPTVSHLVRGILKYLTY